MSAKRAPIDPPQLAGYTYVDLLGSGGYADVFLYEQQMPKRQVAIKVLISDDLGEERQRRFTAEANTMASLSNHPYIVPIFHADVSPDGRPYLVMEYYPRPNFGSRAKAEQFSVADVLRTGVQVASAVETAHRAGVLHRDIKPANILTSAYGRPGLTDFGISSNLGDEKREEAEGMSIPWSPPEVISGTTTVDARADVYSLAATLYTLLVGRSPFEVPGGPNRSLDLIDRIERAELSPTGRPDVPPELERLLRQAMAKDPNGRPPSAAALARALQAIEVEQRLDMTPFEVSDDDPYDPAMQQVDIEAGATRLRGPTTIVSQPTASPKAKRPAAAPDAEWHTQSARPTGPARVVGPAPVDAPSYDTVVRRTPADPAPIISSAPTAPSPTAPADGSGAVPPSAFAPAASASAAPPPVNPLAATTPTGTDAWAAGPTGPPLPTYEESNGRRALPYVIGVVVAALVAGILAFVLIGVVVGDESEDDEVTTPSSVDTGDSQDPGDGGSSDDGDVPAVEDLRVVLVPSADPATSTYAATWNHPGSEAGDRYVVVVRKGQETDAPETVQQTGLSFNAEPGARVCVTVQALRGEARSDPVESDTCD